MAQTVFTSSSAQTVQRWSSSLSRETSRKSFFTSALMAKDGTMPIQVLTDLESEKGDTIKVDLLMNLTGYGVEGDAPLSGKEEAMVFYQDTVKIDQKRHGAARGGQMSNKRILHDMRTACREALSTWFARLWDEYFFVYLSGTRGNNTDYNTPLTFTGFAGNSIQTPDNAHLVRCGDKAAGSFASGDTMSLTEIDRVITRSAVIGGGTAGVPELQPASMPSGIGFMLVMSPKQAHSLTAAVDTNQWFRMQNSIMAALGEKATVFRKPGVGDFGLYKGVMLCSHKAAVKITLNSIACARALFLGRQAASIAFGTPGNGLRYKWSEEETDHGNQLAVGVSSVFGIKKLNWNGVDFGLMCLDTAEAAVLDAAV